MTRPVQIENLTISPAHPPVIAAEMSGNHNQSLDRAMALVEAAAQNGAHMLKLQTYTADSMTLDLNHGEFFIDDPKSLWHGQSLYRLYQQACTPYEWHEPLFKRCRQLGLVPFSTPFDEDAVAFLEQLDAPCYKIASFENTTTGLIRAAAATGKPIIVSTGMATAAEIDETVRLIRAEGNDRIVLLKCTSAYPAGPQDAHLNTIPNMAKLFDCQVGLSDHTLGIGVALAATVLGAGFIEKHFTLSRSEKGVDAAFSMEPDELAALVRESKSAWQSLGRVQYGPQEAETTSISHRRSLYICRDMQAGESLSPESLRAIRPGLGLPPKHLDQLLGKKVNRPLKKGTPMSWDFIG